MHTTGSRPKLVVSADGRGVVSHAGSRLLADLADATGLTTAFTDALCQLRPRGTGHTPGRIAVDLAVMLTDGGEAIADLALLRDQAEVFGSVASAPTAWRLLADIDPAALDDGFRPSRAAKTGENAGSMLFEPPGDPAPRLSHFFCLVHRHLAHARSSMGDTYLPALLASRNRGTDSQVMSSIGERGDR
ncbi:hypothetical protein GCM10018966_026040 [Streptomyces yanii]